MDTPTLLWAGLLILGSLAWCAGLYRTWTVFFRPLPPQGGHIDVNAPPDVVLPELKRGLVQALPGLRFQSSDARSLVASFSLGRTSVGLRVELSGSTHLRWTLENHAPLRFLRTLSLVFHGLGFLAILAAAVLMPLYVLHHPEPAVRYQAVQTLQIGHFLWPPFLLAALSRRTAVLLSRRVEDLLHNLPHLLSQR